MEPTVVGELDSLAGPDHEPSEPEVAWLDAFWLDVPLKGLCFCSADSEESFVDVDQGRED